MTARLYTQHTHTCAETQTYMHGCANTYTQGEREVGGMVVRGVKFYSFTCYRFMLCLLDISATFLYLTFLALTQGGRGCVCGNHLSS